MINQRKTTTSLATLLLMGLTLACEVHAETSRYEKRNYRDIQSCIVEIGRGANYSGGNRVVHWVRNVAQKNLVEAVILIKTTVYSHGAVVRAYSTECTTGTIGHAIKVRIEEIDGADDAAS